MKYVWRDGAWRDSDGNKMETSGDGICAPRIISDLPAYMSPLGTGLIDGRRARREDLKRHNCREVAPDEIRRSEAFIEREARKAS